MRSSSNSRIHLSAGPLLAYADRVLSATGIATDDLPPGWYTGLNRARKNGYVTLDFGDRLACHLFGVHPFDIWGAEYDEVVWQADIASERREVA